MGETTTLLFTFVIKQLYEEAGVPELPRLHRNIEVMNMVDNILIKDLANPILRKRTQPPPIIILINFEGPSISIETIDRLDICDI